MSSRSRGDVSASRKSQNANALGIKCPLRRSGPYETNSSGRIQQRGWVLIARAEPVFQNECRNSERVEPFGDWATFMICQVCVPTSGTNDDRRARSFLFGRQVRSQGGDVDCFSSDRTGCATGPKN